MRKVESAALLLALLGAGCLGAGAEPLADAPGTGTPTTSLRFGADAASVEGLSQLGAAPELAQVWAGA